MQEQQAHDWESDVIARGYSDSLPFAWWTDKGIGGDMGQANSDFEVQEIPAYLPCGSGEHLYLLIQKEGMTTLTLMRILQDLFDLQEIDIGYAGKKDANAVTRQWFSLHTMLDKTEAIAKLAEIQRLQILEVTRHTNKLRMGHLHGNHFKVNLYGVSASDAEITESCQKLSELGFINYFGKQRFGFDGDNIKQAFRVLEGGKAKHQMKKLYISALQSGVFNLYAGRRILDIGYETRLGDVLQKIGAGCFVSSNPDIDNQRAQAGEVVVTGILPGQKVMLGHGYSYELEKRCVQDFGLAWADDDKTPDGVASLSRVKKFADGTRRPLWVRPGRLAFERLSEDAIKLEFSLPPGAYATILLRHLCASSFTR